VPLNSFFSSLLAVGKGNDWTNNFKVKNLLKSLRHSQVPVCVAAIRESMASSDERQIPALVELVLAEVQRNHDASSVMADLCLILIVRSPNTYRNS
jgi:hypothetical protein